MNPKILPKRPSEQVFGRLGGLFIFSPCRSWFDKCFLNFHPETQEDDLRIPYFLNGLVQPPTIVSMCRAEASVPAHHIMPQFRSTSRCSLADVHLQSASERLLFKMFHQFLTQNLQFFKRNATDVAKRTSLQTVGFKFQISSF